MINKISLAQIKASIELHYSLSISKVEEITAGADLTARVYKLQAENGNQYFAKVRQNLQPETGVFISQYLSDAGVQHMCSILKTHGGNSILCVDDVSISISPFIHGQNGFERKLTETQWRTFGKALRQVHELTVPSSILNKLKIEQLSSTTRDTVQEILSKVDILATVDTPSITFINLLRDHQNKLQALIDAAKTISLNMNNDPQDHWTRHLVLCHSDLHGGNIMIDDLGHLTMIDWDEAMIAPRERDLMFIGGGVGNVWNNQTETKWFFEGYGAVDINQDLITYYRCERILQDIEEYAHGLLFSSEGGAERSQWCKDFEAQFASNGVVDIALKITPNY